MTSLEQLAAKYRCDKLLRHSYIPYYEWLLRDQIVESLLEIGIGTHALMDAFVKDYVVGASIYMWRDYFPAAAIYACDIDKSVLINEGRIKSFACDQSSQADLIKLVNEIGMQDVIIDDGSHVPEHQVFTARFLLPYLREDGLYIVEDCQAPEVVAGALGGEIHIFEKTPDDVLVVVRR